MSNEEIINNLDKVVDNLESLREIAKKKKDDNVYEIIVHIRDNKAKVTRIEEFLNNSGSFIMIGETDCNKFSRTNLLGEIFVYRGVEFLKMKNHKIDSLSIVYVEKMVK